MMMVGTAFAQVNMFYVEDFEVGQDQLGSNNVRVYVKAHFDNYVSAWMATFTFPEGITCRTMVKGSDMTLNYCDQLGDMQSYTPGLNISSDKNKCVVASMEAAYDADGNYMGAACWAPGDYDQMWQLVLNVDENFEGGEMLILSEPGSSGWGDHSNDCPQQYQYNTITYITVAPGPGYELAGEIVFGDVTEDGKLPISYNGPEDVTMTVLVNGVEVALVDGMAQLEEGDNYVYVHVECNEFPAQMESSYQVNWIPAVPQPQGDNVFYIENMTAFHGDVIVIPVQMNNELDILAFQTDIVLPAGFNIVTDNDELMITPSSRLSSDHVIMADKLSNGDVRVICYTPSSRVISGNSGDLFYITVAVPENAEGDYTIQLHNSLLTAAGYTELSIPNTTAVLHVNAYIPGDVNNSGTVTVTDIVVTAHYILQHNPQPFIFAAADMNQDGNITVTDIMLIANLIMTPTMNAPMRMPALWNNGDIMSGEDVTLMPGETRTVSIALDNEMAYSAFQLDLNLPEGLTASNFQVTNRAGSHTFEVSTLENGNIRALCYSPVIAMIEGNDGALLTFDVISTGNVTGDITVDGIELVTADCQAVMLNAFAIGVNNATGVNNLTADKSIDHVDYFNLAGQRLDRPENGVTLIVTTYTDGTRSTSKVVR